MKQIAILQDFGINDVSEDDEIIQILDKLDIDNNTDVELDITGCLIDYPATSKIIDRIVNQLKAMEGQKKLSIIIDYRLPKSTLTNWLFLGSVEFNMREKKEMAIDEIEKTIQEYIRPKLIEIVIATKDSKGEIVNEFTFR